MVAQRLYTTEELGEIFKIKPAAVHKYLIDHGICFFKDKEKYEISEWDLREWDRKRKKKKITRGKTEEKNK